MDSLPFDGGGVPASSGTPVFFPVMLFNAQTQTWDCSFCDRAFLQPNDLEMHMNNEHGHLFNLNLPTGQECMELQNVPVKQESPLDNLDEVINSVIDAATISKGNEITIRTEPPTKVETVGGKASVNRETPHRLCIMREKYWCEKCKLGFWKRDCFSEHNVECHGEIAQPKTPSMFTTTAPLLNPQFAPSAVSTPLCRPPVTTPYMPQAPHTVPTPQSSTVTPATPLIRFQPPKGSKISQPSGAATISALGLTRPSQIHTVPASSFVQPTTVSNFVPPPQPLAPLSNLNRPPPSPCPRFPPPISSPAMSFGRPMASPSPSHHCNQPIASTAQDPKCNPQTTSASPVPVLNRPMMSPSPVPNYNQPAPSPAANYNQPAPSPAANYNQQAPSPAPNYNHQVLSLATAFNQSMPSLAPPPSPAQAFNRPTPSPSPAPAFNRPTPSPSPAPAFNRPTPSPSPSPAFTRPTPSPSPAPAFTRPTPSPSPGISCNQPMLSPSPAMSFSVTAPSASPAPNVNQPTPLPSPALVFSRTPQSPVLNLMPPPMSPAQTHVPPLLSPAQNFSGPSQLSDPNVLLLKPSQTFNIISVMPASNFISASPGPNFEPTSPAPSLLQSSSIFASPSPAPSYVPTTTFVPLPNSVHVTQPHSTAAPNVSLPSPAYTNIEQSSLSQLQNLVFAAVTSNAGPSVPTPTSLPITSLPASQLPMSTTTQMLPPVPSLPVAPNPLVQGTTTAARASSSTCPIAGLPDTLQPHPCELCFEVFPSELDLIGHVVDFHCQEYSASETCTPASSLPAADTTSPNFDLSLVDLTCLFDDLPPPTVTSPIVTQANSNVSFPFPMETFEPPINCWTENVFVKQEPPCTEQKVDPIQNPMKISTKDKLPEDIDVKPVVKQERSEDDPKSTCGKINASVNAGIGASTSKDIYACTWCTMVLSSVNELSAHERIAHANIFSRKVIKLEEKVKKKKKKESSKDMKLPENSLDGLQYCQNLIDDLKKKLNSAEKVIKTVKRNKKREEQSSKIEEKTWACKVDDLKKKLTSAEKVINTVKRKEKRAGQSSKIEEKTWACKVTPSGIKIVTKGPENKDLNPKKQSSTVIDSKKGETYECLLCGVETLSIDSFKRHVNAAHPPKSSVPKVNKFRGKPPFPMWEKADPPPVQIPVIDLDPCPRGERNYPKSKFVELPGKRVEVIDIADSPEPAEPEETTTKLRTKPRVSVEKPYLKVPFKDTKCSVKHEPVETVKDESVKKSLLKSTKSTIKHDMISCLKQEPVQKATKSSVITQPPATPSAPKKYKFDRELRIVLKRVDDDDFDFSDVIFLKRLC